MSEFFPSTEAALEGSLSSEGRERFNEDIKEKICQINQPYLEEISEIDSNQLILSNEREDKREQIFYRAAIEYSIFLSSIESQPGKPDRLQEIGSELQNYLATKYMESFGDGSFEKRGFNDHMQDVENQWARIEPKYGLKGGFESFQSGIMGLLSICEICRFNGLPYDLPSGKSDAKDGIDLIIFNTDTSNSEVEEIGGILRQYRLNNPRGIEGSSKYKASRKRLLELKSKFCLIQIKSKKDTEDRYYPIHDVVESSDNTLVGDREEVTNIKRKWRGFFGYGIYINSNDFFTQKTENVLVGRGVNIEYEEKEKRQLKSYQYTFSNQRNFINETTKTSICLVELLIQEKENEIKKWAIKPRISGKRILRPHA